MRMEARRIPPSISPRDLRDQLGSAAAPLVIDVRRAPVFNADETMIAGAIRRPPEDVARWGREIAPGRPVVVYCVHGHEVSQGAASALVAAGVDARFLEGGSAGWTELRLPSRRKRGPIPGKWVTRERPKVDRIACPWLIRRFIDPEAEFLYVPSAKVRDVAKETGATPYDIADVEFGHLGDQCSFDAFIRIFDIHDTALDALAVIVRGADTGVPELTPQSPGLVALSQGLSATFADDHEQLSHGMVMYDALYAWCRSQTASMRVRHG
jgi:rhodanese-related sulfurtransferase